MAAGLDLSCLLGRGLLKAPDLPNTSGAKYTRYVQLLDSLDQSTSCLVIQEITFLYVTRGLFTVLVSMTSQINPFHTLPI